MAIQIIGNVATERGKVVDKGTKTHREAVHAAKARSAAAATASVGQAAPTVFARIALDFRGARRYVHAETGREAMLKRTKDPLTHQGTSLVEGDWYGRFSDDSEVVVVSAEQFETEWRQAPAQEQEA